LLFLIYVNIHPKHLKIHSLKFILYSFYFFLFLLNDLRIQSNGRFEIKSIKNQLEIYLYIIIDLFITNSPFLSLNEVLKLVRMSKKKNIVTKVEKLSKSSDSILSNTKNLIKIVFTTELSLFK
jgi:hypothetical protein